MAKQNDKSGKKPDSIKMEESQLREMVSKIIKESLSMEDVNSQPQFRQVDNLYDYINQNNIQMRQASKFARINAVQARGGERINTVAGDGTQETTNVAKPGDFIVNNVGNPNNKWIIDAATFQKKYVPVQGQPGVFMPKGGPMMAGQINEPISFTAPWGEKMNIDKGGYIMQTPGSQTDIYGISGRDFDDTYRFDKLEEQKEIKMNESQIREMIHKIISESLNELSPDYYSANAQKAQNALNGFGGKMMKMFNPNKYNKIQNQAQKFQSYSNDHPDDTYDITSYGAADPMHINNGYQIRNNRTGNVKGFNDANNTIPIRGSVTSNGKYGGEASYLNGMKKMNESQLRKMVSKVIRESLRTLNEGANYMSVLQKYGFQPIESDGDADWVPNEALNNNEAYFISVLTPQGWYHSDVYNYSEEEMFNIAEEITDALQSMGWIEDLTQRGMCGKEEYSDVAYIEAVFDGQYDDMSEGGIGTDTCGSFVVGQDGQCFWMD